MSIIISMATENSLLMLSFYPDSLKKEFKRKGNFINSETVADLNGNIIKHKKNKQNLFREIKNKKNLNIIKEIKKYKFLENNSLLIYSDDKYIMDAENLRLELVEIIEQIEMTESKIIQKCISCVTHFFSELKIYNNIKVKGKYVIYRKNCKTEVGQLGYNEDEETNLTYEEDDEEVVSSGKVDIDNMSYTYKILEKLDYKYNEKICTILYDVKNITNNTKVDLTKRDISNKILKEISKKNNHFVVVNQHFIKKELIEGWKGELSYINNKNPKMTFLGYEKNKNIFDFKTYSTKKFGCEKYTYNLYYEDKIVYFEDSLIDMIEKYIIELLEKIKIAEKESKPPIILQNSYKNDCLLFYLLNDLPEKKDILHSFFEKNTNEFISYDNLTHFIKKRYFALKKVSYKYEIISSSENIFLLNANWSFKCYLDEYRYFTITPLTPKHAFIFYENSLLDLMNDLRSVGLSSKHMFLNSLYLLMKKINSNASESECLVLFKNDNITKEKINKIINTEEINKLLKEPEEYYSSFKKINALFFEKYLKNIE